MTDLPAFAPYAPLPCCKSRTSRPSTTMCENDKPKPKPRKPGRTIRSTATWDNVFLPLFGRKGPGSAPDFDLRPKSFRKDVSDPAVCDCCKGTGIMRCSFCSGTKFHAPDGSEQKCPACDGKVNVTCSVCFGTAKNIELEGNWWEKGVASLFK